MTSRISPEKRLWRNIITEPNTGCWLWIGHISKKGYGKCQSFEGGQNNGTTSPHRLSYQIYKGAIPYGLEVDHKCRVRSCCNPDHLKLVTRTENVNLRFEWERKNKPRTHCRNGHSIEFDKISFVGIQYGRPRGYMIICNICRKASQQRADAKRNPRIKSKS